jgi:hypothetical protein
MRVSIILAALAALAAIAGAALLPRDADPPAGKPSPKFVLLF